MDNLILSLISGAFMGAAFWQPGKPWTSGLRAGCASAAYFLAIKVLT